MRPIKLIQHWSGLYRYPGELGDQILRAQFSYLQKNVPVLYLTLILTGIAATIAGQHLQSLFAAVVLPGLMLTACFVRMVIWFRRRDSKFIAPKAQKQMVQITTFSPVIALLATTWGLYAWYGADLANRFEVPLFLALGGFSTAYCLSFLPFAAILCLTIAVVPISVALLLTGQIVEMAAGVCLVASMLFLIGLIRRQFSVMVEMLTLQQQLKLLSQTDSLTGLYNRRALRELLETALTEKGSQRPITLAMIDLDGFKPVNDVHGHIAGDRLLEIVAKRMQRSVGSNAKIARLGGDEFAILFTDLLPEICQEFLKLLELSVGQPCQISDVELTIGASTGIVSCLSGERDAQSLLFEVDSKMYAVKKRRYQEKGIDRRIAA